MRALLSNARAVSVGQLILDGFCDRCGQLCLDARLGELLALDRMIDEADLDQHRRHGRAEQHVVRVLAHAAIAGGAAPVAKRAACARRGRRPPTATAPRSTSSRTSAMSGSTPGRGVPVSLRSARPSTSTPRGGEHVGLVAALGARRRGIRVDADEQVARAAGSATAMRWRRVSVRSPVRVSATSMPRSRRRVGDEVRECEGQLLLVRCPGAWRAQVRAAVAGIEDHDRGRLRSGGDAVPAQGMPDMSSECRPHDLEDFA